MGEGGSCGVGEGVEGKNEMGDGSVVTGVVGEYCGVSDGSGGGAFLGTGVGETGTGVGLGVVGVGVFKVVLA